MKEISAAVTEMGEFVDKLGKLVRLDCLLLGAEIREARRELVTAVSAVAVAAALGFFGLGVLLSAAVLFLIELGLRPSLAAIIVAAMVFVIAAACASSGMAKLKTWSLTPHRTLKQVREDIEALRASISNVGSSNT